MAPFRTRLARVLLATLPSLLSVGLAAGSDDPGWIGVGSCAATACHGGRREPLDLKGSEYSFWGSYDPHTRAFSVLFDDRSRRIEKNLKKLADIDTARPFENDLCLKCHVHQEYDTTARRPGLPSFENADGVGCESCHGPAARYLVPHAQAGWPGLSDRQKLEGFGMRPTKDLLARGQICAECHVGKGAADVNHDLIAAGHPRLGFEYGSQLAKLPKHWRTRDDRARHPDYEAKVWALGQISTARAALGLLEARAIRAIPDDSASPWPEFAEYSCFSCHHDLAPAPRLRADNRPGQAPWGTWSLPRAGSMASNFLGAEVPALGPLRELMSRPTADPAVVARRARAASDELGHRADAINRGLIRPADVRSLLADSLKGEPEASPLDWDLAAQRYLAIVALDKAMAESDPRFLGPKVRIGLDRMLADLDLPIRAEPRGALFDSPRRFNPARINDDLRAVREAIPRP